MSWKIITFFVSLVHFFCICYTGHCCSKLQKLKMLTFLLAFSRWQICQILMRIWRFQKIKLYFFILLQIKNWCKLNLFFTCQINNVNNITSQIVFPNYPKAAQTLVSQVNSTLKWPLNLINNSQDAQLDHYGNFADLNSLQISNLIRSWKEVTRLFDFCKILLSNTCMKNSSW